MASSSIFRFIIAVILLVNLTRVITGIGGEIVFEQGYTVTTVLDGDKLHVNPYSVFSPYGSSSDLIILDSVKSTFYTVSFSDSQVSEIKKLSGNGDAGYKDGDLGSALFNKPKSFALDKKNNIYIADKTNHVIRKISKSGDVTTIAGGYVQKTGKADGPAQNASFSDDFEVAFDPQRCALLISDHGNRLIRQLDLKAEDCSGSSSGSGLGSTAAWGLSVGIACLVGAIVGFAIRHYVLPHEASGHHQLTMTWKHYLTNLAKQAATFFYVTKSAIASFELYQVITQFVRLSFSQLSLVLGLNVVKPPLAPVKYVSLLEDCDDLGNNETTKTQDLVDELKDLVYPEPVLIQENVFRGEEKNVDFPRKIDRQIYDNFAGFVESSKTIVSVESWEIGS